MLVVLHQVRVVSCEISGHLLDGGAAHLGTYYTYGTQITDGNDLEDLSSGPTLRFTLITSVIPKQLQRHTYIYFKEAQY